MSEQTVTWEEPPVEPRGRKGGMRAAVEQLKTRPGQWARIEASPSAAWQYARNHPEIETTVRNQGKPDQAVYARYIGTEGQS